MSDSGKKAISQLTEFQKKLILSLAILFSFLFIINLFMTSIETVSFSTAFYEREYEKLDRPEAIGISMEELMESTIGLLDYIKGNRDDLNIWAEIQGDRRSVFNEREIQHMVDVKDLFHKGYLFRIVTLPLVFLFLVILFFLLKKQALQYISRAYLWSMAVFAFITGLMGAYIYVDFDAFWTKFHEVLFTNDLWLLDPETDILIQMVPLEFFYDIVTRIILIFGSIMIGLAVFSVINIIFEKKGLTLKNVTETLTEKSEKRSATHLDGKE